MPPKSFRLSAQISSDDPSAIRPPMEEALGEGATIKPTRDGFQVEALLNGESAKDLNRTLLSAMRRAEKRTRLRAEWTSDTTTERFFDYVSKGIKRTK